MKFYNRKRELEFFSRVKKMDRKYFVAVYGRRRIGKTTLIKKVFEETSVFYYFVEVKKEETLLIDLSSTFSNAVYTDWYSLFCALFAKYEYIIFDEFQNFFKVNPGILYALQHAWDENEYKTKLIVLGSYVGLMKNIFMNENMPLFGRVDNLVKIKEFTLKETLLVLKDFEYDIYESLQIYAIIGGIPRYLWMFEHRRDFKQLIYDIFVDEFAPLREEAKNLLITEFGSEHRSYFSILQAIAGSIRSISEISDLSGIEPTKLSKYLHELSEIYEILSKEQPVLSNSKKGYKYKIVDHYYRFFFRNIYKNYSIMQYSPEKALEIIFKNLNQYIGFQYEEICRKFLQENPETFGFIPKVIGRHWGRAPHKKGESYNIDLVAYDENNVLFGECKWTNKKVEFNEYKKLLLRSEYVNTGDRRKIYAIFSKSGFEKDLLNLQNENLHLITPLNIAEYAVFEAEKI